MSQESISVHPWKTEIEMSGEKSAPSSRQFADFDKVHPGSETTFCKTISGEDLESFARLSGDRNPLHMDEEFASRTHFQRRVVHGVLLASYVSAMIGMQCPGPGALWTQQSFRWLAPAFIGDCILVTLRVKHKSMGSRTLTIEVKTVNQDGKTVMEGEGTVTALEEIKASQDIPISDRVAFVSGGSRGIGAAISLALARAGAAVVVNYRHSAVEAEQLCAEIRQSGGRAISMQVDVSDYSGVAEAATRACEEFKHSIDLLINNAGMIPEPCPFMQTTWEAIQSALNVHLKGAINCCQAFVPGMMAQKSGRIINIGSAFIRATPPPNWSCFLLAKSTLQALTRCLASELGPYGIRVNSVAPGLVETEGIRGLSERMRKVQAMQTPLRRLAAPSEVAAAVMALCSGAGDFINGAEIPVSGGLQV